MLNAGPRIPGSAVNDIFAATEFLHRSIDPANRLRLRAVVFRCGNADCSGGTLLFARTTHAVYVPGHVVTVLLQWDPPANRFYFRGTGYPALMLSFAYTLPDNLPPGNALAKKRVEVNHAVANCTASPRPVAYMRALVDNIFVNGAAVLAAEAPEPGSEGPAEAE